jgi:hypothetical protein
VKTHKRHFTAEQTHTLVEVMEDAAVLHHRLPLSVAHATRPAAAAGMLPSPPAQQGRRPDPRSARLHAWARPEHASHPDLPAARRGERARLRIRKGVRWGSGLTPCLS